MFDSRRLATTSVLAGVGVVVLLVSLACSTGDEPREFDVDVVDSSNPATATAPTEVPAAVEILPADSVVQDVTATPADADICQTGTIVVKAEDFIGVDPARYDYGSSFPYELVYSRLFKVNAETGEVEPDLAVSYTVSEDGLTYTFRLREDVVYSDGSPLKPADIQFSFARALSERPATTAKYVLGKIEGASDLINGVETDLSGVTVVDESTVEIRLDSPDWNFVSKLVHPLASIVSAANVVQWDPEWADQSWFGTRMSWTPAELPIGTGPLSVAELTTDEDSSVYTPNGYHWNAPPRVRIAQLDPYFGYDLSGLPVYDVFDVFEVGHEVAASFDDGLPTTFDGEPLIGYDLVISERVPDVAFLAFNTALSPYDDVDFRRALVAAADNRTLGYHAEGPAFRDTATGLLTPDMPGFDERPELEPDRAVAKDFAEASRYPEPSQTLDVSIHLTDSLSPFDYDIITRFWSQWLDVDVNVHGMEETDRGYMLSWGHLEAYERMLAAGMLDMRFVEVQPTRNSPEEILGLFRNLFGESAVSPEVEELREMLDAAAAESDAAKRIELYAEIEEHILDRALAIPIAWGSPTKWEVVREWIDGYTPSPYAPLSLDGVTVDTTHPDYPADRPCN